MNIITDYTIIDNFKHDQELKIIKPYRNFGKVINKLLKILSRIKIFNWILFNKFKSKNTDTIIIFDGSIIPEYLKWVKKKHRNSKLIFWYWNPVKYSYNINNIPNGIEIWSYSKKDCLKYDLYFNTQFYLNIVPVSNEISSDIVYVARDKGRGKYIKKLESIMNLAGIKTDFHFIEDDSNNTLNYAEIIKKYSNSRSLFDYYIDSDDGYSLRVMESLVLEKKLITNNSNIIYEDFYNESNIFYFENDIIIEELLIFLGKPYFKIDKEIIEKYSFGKWISRFSNTST